MGHADLEIARHALMSGDPRHAAFHLAGVLADDPLHPEALGLLGSVVDGEDEPELLFDVDEGWIGAVAAHAWVLARLGRWDEALSLGCDVATYRPSRPYATWIAEWVAAGEGSDPGPVLRLLAAACTPTVGRNRLHPSERAALAPLGPVVDALLGREDLVGQALILVWCAGVLRRLGRADEAVGLTRRALAAEPTPLAAVGLGLSLRAAARPGEAVGAFEEAARLEPDDPVYAVEIARALWEDGRHGEALAAVERYLAARPDRDWEAEVARGYLRWHQGLEPEDWLGARVGRPSSPDDPRLAGTAGVGWIPGRAEATLNGLVQLAEKHGILGPGAVPLRSMSCSHLEAPSARLVLSLVSTGRPQPGEAPYTFSEFPEPDPRKPLLPEGRSLWRYKGILSRRSTPVPAVPAPAPAVRDAVHSLASRRFWMPRWWTWAGELAAELGPGAVPDGLACMVHLTPQPEGVQPWDWVQQVQLAAALVVAHLEWQILAAVARGIPDWTTDAAIHALTERALRDPEALEPVAALLERLLLLSPLPGSWFAHTLVGCYLRLPGRDRDQVERFEAVRADIEDGGEGA